MLPPLLSTIIIPIYLNYLSDIFEPYWHPCALMRRTCWQHPGTNFKNQKKSLLKLSYSDELKAMHETTSYTIRYLSRMQNLHLEKRRKSAETKTNNHKMMSSLFEYD